MSKDFEEFAKTCEKIKGTTSKLSKISFLSDFLKSLDDEDIPIAIKLLTSQIFPPWENKDLQVGYSTIVKLLKEVTGLNDDILSKTIVKLGDLGDAAEFLLKIKKVENPFFTKKLTLAEVYNTLAKLAEYKGEGSVNARKNLLKKLFINANPLEAKYIVKILTNEMRIGLSEGLIEESITHAFNKTLEEIRNAFLLFPDLSKIAIHAKLNQLNLISIEVLTPTNFMLADFMQTSTEIVNYFKKELICEYKYDGIRCQIHKKGDKVKLFSRKFEEISYFLPEIVEDFMKIKFDFILDSEILPIKGDRPLPFQELQKRLHRKYVDESIIYEVPVVAIVYDVIYYKDSPVIELPLRERKKILKEFEFGEKAEEAKYFLVKNSSDIDRLFNESLEKGFEGLMLKDPDSKYTPGKRGRYWIKLKKEFDTLDVVIVAAEYGHGKRSGVLSDYTFAVKDNDELKVIGKAYSGLTDEEIELMDRKLRELAIKDLGYKIFVKPVIVIEVAFDSIQRSDRHDSGFALRFPRIKRIRYDKSPEEIDTLEKVIEIYNRKKSIYSQ